MENEEFAPSFMQVYRFDINGNYIEPVVLLPNEPIPKDCTPKPIPQPCWKPAFKNGDWVETITNEELLEPTRKQKNAELNEACKQAILAGFSYEINGVTYWFSYDYEAQGNFRDAKEILSDGVVAAVPWTVRKGGADGPYTRITIDLTTMKLLSLVIMNHKLGKISRYRDELMPIVDAAQDPKEIIAVTWE